MIPLETMQKRPLSIKVPDNNKPDIVLLDETQEKDLQEGNTAGENALLEAAAAGNDRAVRSLIMQGVNRECRDDNDNTPLMLAAGGGHAKVVNYLFYRKASLFPENFEGWTVLEMAVANGESEDEYEGSSEDGSSDNVKVVTLLMKVLSRNTAAWKDYTEREVWGSAISIAAQRGHDGSLKVLLQYLGDNCKKLRNKAESLAFMKQYINACDEDNNTSLMLAVRSPHVKKGVQILIEAGASYTHINKKNQDALHYAAAYGTEEIFSYLLNTIMKDSEYFKQYCEQGHLRKALYASADACDFSNHNASDIDSYHKISLMHVALCLTLGESAARDYLFKPDEKGNILLHLAAGRGKFKTTVHLFYLGASLEARNQAGMTALEMARTLVVPIMDLEQEALGNQQNTIIFLEQYENLIQLLLLLQNENVRVPATPVEQPPVIDVQFQNSKKHNRDDLTNRQDDQRPKKMPKQD